VGTQCYLLRKDYVSAFAESAGDRIRMKSPYREQLSPAFGRCFVRVGLPHDAHDFVSDAAAAT
jgi:hypothetical protein